MVTTYFLITLDQNLNWVKIENQKLPLLNIVYNRTTWRASDSAIQSWFQIEKEKPDPTMQFDTSTKLTKSGHHKSTSQKWHFNCHIWTDNSWVLPKKIIVRYELIFPNRTQEARSLQPTQVTPNSSPNPDPKGQVKGSQWVGSRTLGKQRYQHIHMCTKGPKHRCAHHMCTIVSIHMQPLITHRSWFHLQS